MCEASPCGCQVITKSTRESALVMFLRDRIARIQLENGAELQGGEKVFTAQEFRVLMSLLGFSSGSKGAEDTFNHVSVGAENNGVMPRGFTLELLGTTRSSIEDSGYDHEIYLRKVI